ncbi:hypothetical protein VCHA48O428_20304 [Vibrio chagasii]|nr:hypothetical protein VCHA48O428_20304 [Vibrio chagasii]
MSKHGSSYPSPQGYLTPKFLPNLKHPNPNLLTALLASDISISVSAFKVNYHTLFICILLIFILVMLCI